MAFFGQQSNHNKKKQGQNSFNSKGRGFVQRNPHCNSSGNQPGCSQGNSRGVAFAQKNSSSSKNDLVHTEEKPTCPICWKSNNTALKCFNGFNHSVTPEEIPQALAAVTIADNQDSEWFPDTVLQPTLQVMQVIYIP